MSYYKCRTVNIIKFQKKDLSEMFEYSKYKIPIKGLKNSKKSYNFQEIIFIKSDESDLLLEISPLEGFSNESINEIENIINTKNSFNISKYPSFEFALENSKKIKKNNISIKTSILVGNNEDIIKKVSKFFNLGFNSYKIKLSKKDYRKKIDDLKSINLKTIFRVDFNNEFTIEEAKNIINNIDLKLEFLEGILQNESFENYLLLKDSKHKLCLDINSKNLYYIDQIIKNKIVSYIAIKPKLLGNEKKIKTLISNCYINNINSYISSTFETQIGFNKSIFLAKYLDDVYKEEIVHGFGTYDFLDKSLLDGISIDSGFINSIYSKFNIDNLYKYQTKNWKKVVNLEMLETLNYAK